MHSHAVILKRFLLSLLLSSTVVQAQPQTRPNVLVVLVDDIGWGDYQCYNPQGKIPSPNIDQLAREGMRFTDAHEPAALCSPSRYSILTGNYPWRGRSAGGTWGFNTPCQILPGQKTLANFLQAAGYRTAMFGKAGFGGKFEMKGRAIDFSKPMIDGPKSWGFDYSFIIPRGHQSTPHVFLENEVPSCGVAAGGAKNGMLADPAWAVDKVGERLLAAAQKFLDDVSAKNKAAGNQAPFFIHFCTDGAHGPYVPPAKIGNTAIKGVTHMTEHTDMVYETDVLLGKLVAMLKSRGLLENTLICFTSDNGGLPCEMSLGHDAVGGLRGGNPSCRKGGIGFPSSFAGREKSLRQRLPTRWFVLLISCPPCSRLSGSRFPQGNASTRKASSRF